MYWRLKDGSKYFEEMFLAAQSAPQFIDDETGTVAVVMRQDEYERLKSKADARQILREE